MIRGFGDASPLIFATLLLRHAGFLASPFGQCLHCRRLRRNRRSGPRSAAASRPATAIKRGDAALVAGNRLAVEMQDPDRSPARASTINEKRSVRSLPRRLAELAGDDPEAINASFHQPDFTRWWDRCLDRQARWDETGWNGARTRHRPRPEGVVSTIAPPVPQQIFAFAARL
jgi:hypothetical protein